jgi:RNA-directed DNA polymerase
MQLADGTLVPRTKGTPQGGVGSPVLSNLFLHYAFEVWMTRTFPGIPWCRYADDGLGHCKTEQEAHAITGALAARLTECGLTLHPDKTQIVYCKDGSRKGRYPNTQFDFLGYTLRPRVVKNRKRNSVFVSFTPAVSSTALTAMRQTTRQRNFRNRTDLSLDDIARYHNPVLRGGGVLRAVLSFSDVPGAAAFQPDVDCLGNAEVPTASRTQGASEPLHRGYREATATSVRALAARDSGRVCLMGAV